MASFVPTLNILQFARDKRKDRCSVAQIDTHGRCSVAQIDTHGWFLRPTSQAPTTAPSVMLAPMQERRVRDFIRAKMETLLICTILVRIQ